MSYHVETFFQTYKPEKKSIRVVFRDELDGDVTFNVALRKLSENDEKQKKIDDFFLENFNFFESLQIASNRSESLPDGSEWIRMDPNDLWQLKNLEKSRENDRTTRKNFENFAKKWSKKSFFFVKYKIILISLKKQPRLKKG